MNHPFRSHDNMLARRTFLRRVGLGSVALSSLLDGEAGAATLADVPHHRPRIKRVIHLCMAGGPSHLETFDNKPELARLDGQPMPESLTAGQPIAQLQNRALKVMGPQHPFARQGKWDWRCRRFSSTWGNWPTRCA